MQEIPWIPKKAFRNTVVDKIKMSDDHQLIAFTVDIGNTERCTGGIKNMKTQKVIPNIKLDGISQMEFFGRDHEGRDILYYVELDDSNRPYRVMRKVLGGPADANDTIIFVDDDPTHYIDIAVSKDQKCLFINSGTKEDCEIWIIPCLQKEDGKDYPTPVSHEDLTPKLLVPRIPDVRVHIEHTRNFFLIITNSAKGSQNYILQTLDDEHLNLELKERSKKWVNLLAPKSDESLIISEFDCFHNFIAVYVR